MLCNNIWGILVFLSIFLVFNSLEFDLESSSLFSDGGYVESLDNDHGSTPFKCISVDNSIYEGEDGVHIQFSNKSCPCGPLSTYSFHCGDMVSRNSIPAGFMGVEMLYPRLHNLDTAWRVRDNLEEDRLEFSFKNRNNSLALRINVDIGSTEQFSDDLNPKGFIDGQFHHFGWIVLNNSLTVYIDCEEVGFYDFSLSTWSVDPAFSMTNGPFYHRIYFGISQTTGFEYTEPAHLIIKQIYSIAWERISGKGELINFLKASGKCSSGVSNSDTTIINNEIFPEWAWYVIAGVGGLIALIVLLVFTVLTCCFCIFLFCKKKKLGVKRVSVKDRLSKLDDIERNEEMKVMAEIRINSELFQVNFVDVDVKTKIGRGGYNTVYLAEFNGSDVAFKVFDTKFILDSKHSFSAFEREVEIMSGVAAPNIVQFYGAVCEPPRVGILMEYCSGGNLMEFIQSRSSKEGVGLVEKIRFLKEIALGMKVLHSKNIIHRDLKPENSLLTANKIIKITDFGLSRMCETIDAMSTKTQNIGTSIYMAPEITKGEYDGKSDVFSYSLIIYNLLSENFSHFGEKTGINIQLKISSDKDFRPDVNNGIDLKIRKECNWLIEMMLKCWEYYPKDRYSFDDIIKLFGKYENEKK